MTTSREIPLRRSPVLVLVLLIASACGSQAGAAKEPAGSGGTPGASVAHDSPSCNDLVYAAVVRQLVEVDHGFGGAASSYQRVYVIDGAVPHAGDPMRPQSRLPAKPFDPHTKAQIARQLDDLPPLAFVSHPDQVIARRNANPLGHVIHQGVLVSLGRVKWIDDHTAQVPNNRWQTGLSGQWLTYIVKLRHGTWHVAGVLNGTMAIS